MTKPQNPQSIRWHKGSRGPEWQYWNWRAERWCRFTKEPLSAHAAQQRAARACYGCAPDEIHVLGDPLDEPICEKYATAGVLLICR